MNENKEPEEPQEKVRARGSAVERIVMPWISVEERLPPCDMNLYPIQDSEGCEAWIYGSVIKSDFSDSKKATEEICRIKFWQDCPIIGSSEA